MRATRARRAVSGSRKTTNAHPGGGGRDPSARRPEESAVSRRRSSSALATARTLCSRTFTPPAASTSSSPAPNSSDDAAVFGVPFVAPPGVPTAVPPADAVAPPAAAGRSRISPFPPRRRQLRARPRQPPPRPRLRAVPRDHHAVHAPGEPPLQRALQPRGIVGDGSRESSQEYRRAGDGRHELRAGVSHAHEGDGDVVRDPLHAHDRHRGRQDHRPQVRGAVRQVVDRGPREEIASSNWPSSVPLPRCIASGRRTPSPGTHAPRSAHRMSRWTTR